MTPRSRSGARIAWTRPSHSFEARSGAGPDGPRPLRPPIRDRGGAPDGGRRARGGRSRSCLDAGTVERVEVVDRRWRPGGGRPGHASRGGRSRGRRAGARSGLALAGRRRLHVSRGGDRAGAARSRRGRPGCRRASDPGDARRDAGRDVVPPDLRRRRGWRAGRRVRPVATRPARSSMGPFRRRRRCASGGRSVDVDLVARRARPPLIPRGRRRSRQTSSSGPTACARSSPARPR